MGDAGDPQLGARIDRDAIRLQIRLERERRPQASGDARPASVVRYKYTSVPACTGNDPNSQGADAFCAEAALPCPDGELLYWIYQAPATAAPGSGWSQVGQRCQSIRESDSGRVEFPGFTQADFQRLPLPAGRPVIEPGNGYTLVGVPTNVYADAEPVTLGTSLLGFPVQVRATPSRYEWEFGDGSGHGPTSDPGSPYPELSITHEYAAAGAYPVTLVTYYVGEYSVAGGPWLPIVGEAAVRSDPVTVEALAGRNQLVAGASG